MDDVEVTNGTSEANYLLALALLRPGDAVAMEQPNYMQLPGIVRSLGAEVRPFHLRQELGWEPDWEEFERAVTPETRLLYLSNPNNPTGSVLSDEAMRRIVERCGRTGTWLLADEVYLGAEIERPRTRSFWGLGDRVIVTSGLSKAYGIPGVRVGWIVGPQEVVAQCWSQHDYLTIGPNKMSDRIARTVVEPHNREQCYAQDPRDPPPQSAHRPRVDRRLRRPAVVARAGGGRHRPGQLRRGRAEPRRRRARAHAAEHADRPGQPRRPGRLPAHLAGGPGGVPPGRPAPDWRRTEAAPDLTC